MTPTPDPNLSATFSRDPRDFTTFPPEEPFTVNADTCERVEQAPGMPVIPGYIVTGEIARGGMGRVLAGRELALDREVAIKTLLARANPTRFLIESTITAKLPHPNIPPVYALGTLDDASPYLAMKFIRGRTLAGLLEERPDPSHDLPQFVRVFEQIAQAVGFAHSRGVIHRDLKPLNVMVGEFGEVQVMDWGLAKDLKRGEGMDADPAGTSREAGVTQAGAIFGTPAYMPPEQALGEAVDERADVFALGATLMEILTGERPWGDGPSAVVVARASRAMLSDCHETLA